MAERAVSFVVVKLGNHLVQELILLHGVGDQVEQLQRGLQSMQCFLRDADTKRKTNESVRNWVKQIRDVAYEAEDIIDTFIINVASRHGRRSGVSGFLNRPLLAITHVVGRYRARKEITAIMAKISEISANRITFGIKNLDDENGGGVQRLVPARRPIVPHVEDSDVVAFDGHMSALVEQLLHPSEKRSVMSIVGMGGLGKTTLAKKVYNSVDVKREFDIRVWITVSQGYGSVELLNEILEQVRKDKEKLGQREVIEKLHDSLQEKRYLIVMDDVWSEDVWEQLQAAFPDGKNGSRVLITTRSFNVARFADPNTLYELRLLTEDESLELLLKKAFANQDGQANCPEDLRSLGRQLVKLCNFLPLALVVVGGLLSIKGKEYNAWQRVLETMSWQFKGEKCMDILVSSYEDLPHYLKSCFLYLAAFPEDYEIQADRLIKLWIAEGFIPHQDKGTIEETAEDCLEELTQRCMVQVVSRKSNGRSIESCRVHDLLRELAVSKAKEDEFLVIYNHPNQDAASPGQGSGRRAAFHNLDGLKGLTIPNLRSLLAFNMEQANFRDSGAQLKLLRVIDLSGAFGIKSLLEEIKAMIHLRYLSLRDAKLEVIPSSIGHLQNLETLHVGYRVKKLPPTIWNIKKLRHVLVYGIAEPEGPPPSADLPNLQTLSGVSVPKSWDRGLPNITSVRKLALKFGFEDRGKILSRLLEKLDHLLSLTVDADRPELVSQPKNYAIPSCTSNCLNDGNEAMNVEAVVTIPSGIDTRAFPCHHRIQSMELYGRWYTTTVDSHEFPPYLVELSLSGSDLEHDPMPTLEKLQNLRVLVLEWNAFMGKRMICSAGGFPQLQSLFLFNLHQLEEWCLEADTMQKITSVHIVACEALRVVPEFQRLPNLQELELDSELMDRIRVDGGEDHYKIQNVQSVSIR